MPTSYSVEPGDCISSIAYRHGFYPDTVWQHEGNANLKRLRQDPNVLLAGDSVMIPDKETKEVDKATDKRHRFVRKGVPAQIRLQILDGHHQPRANLPYKLRIDGVQSTGSTDSNGMIIHDIPPDAQQGLLEVKDDKKTERYELKLGHADPHNEVRGVQQRLRNLGYPVGVPSGQMDEPTRTAIRTFQARNHLSVTGEADAPTLSRLKEVHGC